MTELDKLIGAELALLRERLWLEMEAEDVALWGLPDAPTPEWTGLHRRCDLVLDQDGHLVDATENAAIPPGAVGSEGE